MRNTPACYVPWLLSNIRGVLLRVHRRFITAVFNVTQVGYLRFAEGGNNRERGVERRAERPSTAKATLRLLRGGYRHRVGSLVYFLSMWAFGNLFQDAAAPLGSLFTLIGAVSGAYFGIKVSNDTSQRSQGAIERAHGRAEEANKRAQQAHATAQQALAELAPDVARRIVQGGSGEAAR